MTQSKAGTRTHRICSKALHLTSAQTVVGPLTWDKTGDIVNSSCVFYVWHNGSYAEM
jgi:hypothetical protein